MAKKRTQLIEAKRISYSNCYFAGGLVEGHPHDSLYVQLVYPKAGKEYTLLLTPDELVALINVASAALFKLLLPRRFLFELMKEGEKCPSSQD